MDVWLLILIATKGFMESEVVVEAAAGFHLGYSLGLVKFLWSIFHIHLGLISQNETAKQWKNREHYRPRNVYVHDLDDDEFNILFDKDAFVYDPSRNPWGKGCLANGYSFWCQPRWPSDVTGDILKNACGRRQLKILSIASALRFAKSAETIVTGMHLHRALQDFLGFN